MTSNPTDNTVRQKILEYISDLAPEVDPKKLNPDTPLRDQVEIDSIDFVRMITRIHDELKVNVPESDYGKLDTINHIVSYLTPKAV